MDIVDESTVLRVIDPLRQTTYSARLCAYGAHYQLQRVSVPNDQPELYISPGWIDLHTHVFDGFTELGVPADSVGLNTGVHMLVDAGSAGEATLRGFTKYIVPSSKTRIRAWLNISSIGLVHLREVADLSLINVDRTLAAVLANQPFVCGIKVRSSGLIVGNTYLQPLKLAILCAREAGLPIMVHIGEAPPVIDDILDLLSEGDVITHCYHGKLGNPWTKVGKPTLSLERALARGVLLDVGHGAASFHWEVALRAIAAGISPFSISTDVHIRNIHGPVYDLYTTMTKLLHCGLPLESVIHAVTLAPALVLRERNWCNMDGTLQRATIFRVTDHTTNGRIYQDSTARVHTPQKYITPVAVISENGLLNIAE